MKPVPSTSFSKKAASVPEYASTRPRGSKSNWYINKGLDIYAIGLIASVWSVSCIIGLFASVA